LRGSLLLLTSALFACSGCATVYSNANPLGDSFPKVVGQDLNEAPHELPGEHAGKPVLYLVGTVQETQFDIDRWLVGLLLAKTPVTFVEVPTIAGLVPSLFLQGTINGGMREGIPAEDWGGVVTLYGEEAEKVVSWLGNEIPRNARVLLLNAKGEVIWFHDRGFSPARLVELDQFVRAQGAEPKSKS
jgi:hypothetical protein